MKVAITTSSFGTYDPSPLERLRREGFEIRLNPHGRKLSEMEAAEFAKDVDGILAGTEPLTEWVMAQVPTLKAISRCGVGMDNVDCDAARKRGIGVYNTPFGPTLAVAELTVGLILNLLRAVTQMDRELRNGIWKKKMGNQLRGKQVGIIGFGRIGQRVAQLLLPFGVAIGYFDNADISCTLPCEPMDFQYLLSTSDIVSLHLSAINNNRPLIGEAELKLMREGSRLVNLSRGGIVDEDALFDALSRGQLAGAAVDVFEREPYTGPLTQLDTAILTPHVGSYAMESRIEMEMQAVENLINGLKIKNTTGIVPQ